MKRSSDSTPTAEKVLDPAEGLLQQRGHNGFPFDDVSQLVGFKKPNIHHYFATLAQLASKVTQRFTHLFRAAPLDIVSCQARA